MKIPNKIYGKVVQNIILDFSIQNNSGIEYIRKDALLKWLKEEIGQIPYEEMDMFQRGQSNIYERVIDKINLLTDNEGNEGIFTYSITGEYRAGSPSDNDLILVDEAELTEFEQAVKRTMRQYYSPGQAEDETVRQVASNLRFLARKELEKLPHDE